MLQAILQPEISSLESQVAQLQSQLAAQQRITLLNEAESVADGAIQALQGAVVKVSALAPDAIANLKLAVLNLFQGGDGASDNDGNQPITPAPQPDLNGQTWDWACPLATPLCCLLEDVPTNSLKGQSVQLACVVSDAPEEQDYIEMVQVSEQVAYQRKHDGEIICTYLAGNNKHRLKLWGEWLCVTHSVGTGFEVRQSQRLTNFKHELKVWGMSLMQIQRLAETNTTKQPPSNYGDAPKRKGCVAKTGGGLVESVCCHFASSSGQQACISCSVRSSRICRISSSGGGSNGFPPRRALILSPSSCIFCRVSRQSGFSFSSDSNKIRSSSERERIIWDSVLTSFVFIASIKFKSLPDYYKTNFELLAIV
jgi:hypothetical protein